MRDAGWGMRDAVSGERLAWAVNTLTSPTTTAYRLPLTAHRIRSLRFVNEWHFGRMIFGLGVWARLIATTILIYSGRANQIHVSLPRIEADLSVDGALTEPVWQQAAVLTGFSQFS